MDFQRSGEIKAVEALSFTKCSSAISKALETSEFCKKLGRDPTKELTFIFLKDEQCVLQSVCS